LKILKLFQALDKIAGEQRTAPAILMGESLSKEVEWTRTLARHKQQNGLARDIIPLAHQLMNTADAAKLVQKEGNVQTFKGQNYAVRCLKKEQEEKIEVYCRRGEGYVYAVNGKVEEAKGLIKQDRERLAGYAAKSVGQLRQMRQGKKSIGSGISH
jgi:hypothetical protein